MATESTDAAHLILVLGGARAGKSTFALRLARERMTSPASAVAFIATAEGLDDDMQARIKRHRAERPPDWLTVEEPRRLDMALTRARHAEVVIVDCLTLFVSNWLTYGDDQHAGEEGLAKVAASFLAEAGKKRQMVICVSNEVGLGVVPDTPLGRTFRDALGRVNQRFAESAAEVYLLVAGLAMKIK